MYSLCAATVLPAAPCPARIAMRVEGGVFASGPRPISSCSPSEITARYSRDMVRAESSFVTESKSTLLFPTIERSVVRSARPADSSASRGAG
jgi:hypothetical protein